MYYISDLCNICLKCDNSLINVLTKGPENATIVSKLNTCVSEVKWTLNKRLFICKLCVQKLDSAYDFQQQCIKSTNILNGYTTSLLESRANISQCNLRIVLSKTDISQDRLDEYVKSHPKNLKPNIQLVSDGNLITPITKLILTNPAQGSFQNIYLVPTNLLNINNGYSFLNLNDAKPNAPVTPETVLKDKVHDVATQIDEGRNNSVSQIVDDSKLEELSVDVDPNIFNYMSEPENASPELNVTQSSKNNFSDKIGYSSNYKNVNTGEISNEEIVDFFNSGHFLTNPKKCPIVTCTICTETFETMDSLHNHIKRMHNGKFPFNCTYCIAEFALKEDCESHMRKHRRNNSDSLIDNSITLDNLLGKKPDNLFNAERVTEHYNEVYKCEFCPRTFSTAHGLLRHKVTRHDYKKDKKDIVKGTKHIKCKICSKCFSREAYLQLHMRKHKRKGELTKEDYKLGKMSELNVKEKPDVRNCEQNDDAKPDNLEEPKYVTHNSLLMNDGIKIKINLKDIRNYNTERVETIEDVDMEKYGKDMQNDQSDSMYISEEDGLQSPNANLFTIELVDGKPRCVYCNKIFGRKHDLKRHLNNVHMKSIQYKCHICKRKFYEGFHLTRHLRSHYSSLTCSHCNKKFCTVTDIKNHVLNSHDAVTKIDCDVCHISLDDLDVLKEHVEEHMKTIIYKCHICGEKYRECRDLTKHIVEHSGMYTCNNCNKTFCTEKDLVSHLKTKFKCPVCENMFKKKSYLYSHLKTQHSKEKEDVEIIIDTITCL